MEPSAVNSTNGSGRSLTILVIVSGLRSGMVCILRCLTVLDGLPFFGACSDGELRSLRVRWLSFDCRVPSLMACLFPVRQFDGEEPFIQFHPGGKLVTLTAFISLNVQAISQMSR